MQAIVAPRDLLAPGSIASLKNASSLQPPPQRQRQVHVAETAQPLHAHPARVDRGPLPAARRACSKNRPAWPCRPECRRCAPSPRASLGPGPAACPASPPRAGADRARCAPTPPASSNRKSSPLCFFRLRRRNMAVSAMRKMAHHRKLQGAGQGGVLHYTPFSKTRPNKINILSVAAGAIFLIFERATGENGLVIRMDDQANLSLQQTLPISADLFSVAVHPMAEPWPLRECMTNPILPLFRARGWFGFFTGNLSVPYEPPGEGISYNPVTFHPRIYHCFMSVGNRKRILSVMIVNRKQPR